jgi:hypothetical protein
MPGGSCAHGWLGGADGRDRWTSFPQPTAFRNQAQPHGLALKSRAATYPEPRARKSSCANSVNAQTRCAMRRVIIHFGLIGAFFFAIALASSPQLHERLHADAAQSQHECVVTLVSSGGCEHMPCAILVRPAPQYPEIARPVAESLSIAPLFLTGRILEHAPPPIS